MTDLKKERRRQKRLERLGTNNPRCCVCGETDSECLEGHHLQGRAFGESIVIVCRNHHRYLSDDQRDHPKSFGDEPTLIERLAHLLLGMADLFVLLAEQCRKFAAELFAELSRDREA